MNYKKSIYNIIIEKLEDGSNLIYNTYSGVYGVMNIKTQDIYENIESFSSRRTMDDEIIKSVNIMMQAGYIIDAERDELATIKVERSMKRHRMDTLNLTIAPTMDCNMCCPYCFEDKSKLCMNEETQKQLLDFVKNHFARHSSLKQLNISWYGGEPLMQKEIIYTLSKNFIDLCNEKDIAYSAIIITNGALLDMQTAKRLAEECRVNNAQITIDGMKECHNKRRILISGEDSFEIIVGNIDVCKDILPIIIRVNVDKENSAEVDTLAKFFLEEKKWANQPSFYLAPIDLDSSSCGLDNAICLQGEEFGEINIKATKASYIANRESVANTFFPRRKSVFCGGEGAFNYVIDPEGYLYTCYREIGKKEYSTGHLNKPFMITEEYGKWLLSDIHEKCEKCEYLPMCMGGCGLYRIPNGGEPKCFRTYYTYKDLLKLAYEDYLLQKSKSDPAAGN